MASYIGRSIIMAEYEGLMTEDTKVKGTNVAYRYPLTEVLLIDLLPLMEQKTGLSLVPTYSFTRIYREGDKLERHSDRVACEVSATLALEYKSDYLWPIFLAGGDPKGVSLDRGDLLIYRGHETDHWRETFHGEIWVQVFLHYIDRNGPFFPEHRYDKHYQREIVFNYLNEFKTSK